MLPTFLGQGRKVYGLALLLGSALLLRSLALQLFWPMAAADRSAPAIHQTFCTAELLYLRKELEESTRQDMARGLASPKGVCTDGVLRQRWQAQLQELETRCADTPVHRALVARLSQLERATCQLWAQAEALWGGEGHALLEELLALRG